MLVFPLTLRIIAAKKTIAEISTEESGTAITTGKRQKNPIFDICDNDSQRDEIWTTLALVVDTIYSLISLLSKGVPERYQSGSARSH